MGPSDSAAGSDPSRETALPPAALSPLYDVGADEPRNLAGLPRIFHSLAYALSDAQMAALIAMPPNARVFLRVGFAGKWRGPFEIGEFCDDFQIEAAEAVGAPGKIVARFESASGQPLCALSFKVDGQGAGLQAQDPVAAILQEFREELRVMREEMAVERRMAAIAPQQSLADRVQELRAIQDLLASGRPPAGPQADPVDSFAKMAEGFGKAMGVMVKTTQDLGVANQSLNPVAVEAAKAKAWVEVAKEAAPLVVDSVKLIKGMQVKPPAGLTADAKAAAMEVA